jgi:hypothetical protein
MGFSQNLGLVCTDAGITSGVILSEYGYANFGQYGGDRTSWDLSHVNSAINLNTRLSVSDGQSVQCTTSNCPTDQAYNVASDSAADRNSGLGAWSESAVIGIRSSVARIRPDVHPHVLSMKGHRNDLRARSLAGLITYFLYAAWGSNGHDYWHSIRDTVSTHRGEGLST